MTEPRIEVGLDKVPMDILQRAQALASSGPEEEDHRGEPGWQDPGDVFPSSRMGITYDVTFTIKTANPHIVLKSILDSFPAEEITITRSR